MKERETSQNSGTLQSKQKEKAEEVRRGWLVFRSSGSINMPNRYRIYVGRISRKTRLRDLESAFDYYGRIRDIEIKHDYAFIVGDDIGVL